MDILFRTLRADEIDCRVALCREDGVQLLLYKDARCDMNILDETVGAENWQRDHKELKGNIYCGVGIRIEHDCSYGIYGDAPSEFIWKWDAGAESYTEKEKGEASDSFKRACVNWGIGRELYTAPFIWIKADDTKLKEVGGKWRCYDRFTVSLIEYDENRCISYVVIRNKAGNIVYTFGMPRQQITPRTMLLAYCEEQGFDVKEIGERYKINKKSTDDEIEKVLEDLKEHGQERL